MKENSFNLTSKSSSEWNKFILDEFYHLSIKSNSTVFSGQINITKFEDDFRFARVASSGQEIESETYDEFFYLISTANPVRWSNGISGNYLSNGGIVVFDCTKEMKYKFPNKRVSNSFLIPYHYFKSGSDIDSIRQGSKLMYQNMIHQLLGDIRGNDHCLLSRMHVIADLLTITDPRKIVESKIKHEYDAITEFIYLHARNPNLSLDYIAKHLLLSRSKIQAILSEYGTNYTTVVKEVRVDALAKSIKHNMTTNLYQLCFEHGYKSIPSASAQFKSIKGMSLKQYRDNLRG